MSVVRPSYAPDDAPDVRVLWQRTSTARKPHLCYCCNEAIEVGSKYESIGVITDGTFEHLKCHWPPHGYLSACPKYRERDKAEVEEQFQRDADEFFPRNGTLLREDPKGLRPKASGPVLSEAKDAPITNLNPDTSDRLGEG